jgi:WD40 repeat protein
VAFNRKGTLLVTTSWQENMVRVWDTATGKQLARTPVLASELKSPFGACYDKSKVIKKLSPTSVGSCDAFFEGDDAVWIMNAAEGLTRWSFNSGRRTNRTTYLDRNVPAPCVAILCPDESSLAIGLDSGTVLIVPRDFFEKVKARLRYTNGGDDGITGLAFSSNGEWLAVAHKSGKIRLWDIRKNALIQEYSLGLPAESVHRIQFGADRKSLIVVSHGQILSLETGSNRKVATFVTPKERVFAISVDGPNLIGLGDDGSVYAWDAATGARRTNVGGTRASVRWSGGVISKTGPLAALFHDMDIELINTTTGQFVHDNVGSRTVPIQVVLSEKDRVACLEKEGDGSVRIWDISTGKLTKTIPGVSRPPANTSFVLSGDGKRLAVYQNHSLQVWSLEPQKLLRQWEVHPTHPIYKLGLSPNGELLATSFPETGNNEVTLRGVHSGETLASMREYNDGVSLLSWAPDGRVFAIAEAEHVFLMEVATRRERRKLRVDVPSAIAFFHDGRRLAVGTADGTVQVFPMDRDEPDVELMAGFSMVTCIAVSPDGSRIIAASDDTIRVWDASGRPLGVLRGHEGPVNDLVITRDGRKLISASEDGTAVVWDLTAIAPDRAPGKDETTLDQAWLNLGSQNARTGFAALNAFRKRPKESIAILKNHLKPTVAPPAAQVRQWIAELGDPAFAKRERASRTLQDLDMTVEREMRTALAKEVDAEAHTRLKRLLTAIDGPPSRPSFIREIRAVELLETINSSESTQLLESLASGDDSRLTREAKAALGRKVK